MPARVPPNVIDRGPNPYLLPPRTRLWRLHSVHRPAEAFRPAVPVALSGGRFDGTAVDPYSFLYAATEQTTVLCERLLRAGEFDGAGYRIIRRAAIADRRLSILDTTVELRLISLRSAIDLATIGQDDWIVQAEPADFPRTREWAGWLRRIDPSAHGLIWQSRRDRPHQSIILFADRCPPHPLAPTGLPAVDLDCRTGIEWLQQILRPYYVSLEPAPTPAPADPAADTLTAEPLSGANER